MSISKQKPCVKNKKAKKSNRKFELQKLMAIQRMEDALTKRGYSGSNYKLDNVIESHNRHFGTRFKTIDDVICYYVKPSKYNGGFNER